MSHQEYRISLAKQAVESWDGIDLCDLVKLLSEEMGVTVGFFRVAAAHIEAREAAEYNADPSTLEDLR